MATQQQKGNCYLCGAELGKVAMQNHIFKLHDAGEQECVLLKVEGVDKRYWLFIEVSMSATLQRLDSFLRDIWLECCGHMSAFMGSGYQEYGMSRKVSSFAPGTQLRYEYDFGDTTRLLVTFVGFSHREPQRNAVRLLARNAPIAWKCSVCGKPAELFFVERTYEDEDPLFCRACAEGADVDMDMALPVTNSPRMGQCGYTGEFDIYEYVPEKFRGIPRG